MGYQSTGSMCSLDKDIATHHTMIVYGIDMWDGDDSCKLLVPAGAARP